MQGSRSAPAGHRRSGRDRTRDRHPRRAQAAVRYRRPDRGLAYHSAATADADRRFRPDRPISSSGTRIRSKRDRPVPNGIRHTDAHLWPKPFTVEESEPRTVRTGNDHERRDRPEPRSLSPFDLAPFWISTSECRQQHQAFCFFASPSLDLVDHPFDCHPANEATHSSRMAYPKPVEHAPVGERALPHRSPFDHSGNAARRFSIHSGVTLGKVASSERVSAFVCMMQGITAGASPSSGWQANSRRIPLGS